MKRAELVHQTSPIRKARIVVLASLTPPFFSLWHRDKPTKTYGVNTLNGVRLSQHGYAHMRFVCSGFCVPNWEKWIFMCSARPFLFCSMLHIWISVLLELLCYSFYITEGVLFYYRKYVFVVFQKMFFVSEWAGILSFIFSKHHTRFRFRYFHMCSF